MTLDIAQECINLTKIVGGDTFDYKLIKRNLSFNNPRINFLWQVLTSTIKYPQLELYLKDLINCFTIDEIKNIFSSWTILHCMMLCAYQISLGAFVIIINCGVGINTLNDDNDTAAHILLQNVCSTHINNILKLFVERGANLNIINNNRLTILDIMLYYKYNLNRETKKCIMILVDFGARTNILCENNKIYDFIEYYRNSAIKPAIKK